MSLVTHPWRERPWYVLSPRSLSSNGLIAELSVVRRAGPQRDCCSLRILRLGADGRRVPACFGPMFSGMQFCPHCGAKGSRVLDERASTGVPGCKARCAPCAWGRRRFTSARRAPERGSSRTPSRSSAPTARAVASWRRWSERTPAAACGRSARPCDTCSAPSARRR